MEYETEETAREVLDRLRTRLSTKQRNFCEEYSATGDLEGAYKKVYSRPDKTKAYLLLDRWYIIQYIGALVQCSSDSVVISRTECMGILATIARGTNGTNPSDQIRAIIQLSKISGYDSPVKHEVTGPKGNPIEIMERGMTKTAIIAIRDVVLGKKDV